MRWNELGDCNVMARAWTDSTCVRNPPVPKYSTWTPPELPAPPDGVWKVLSTRVTACKRRVPQADAIMVERAGKRRIHAGSVTRSLPSTNPGPISIGVIGNMAP